jgi:DNA-binding SARP family transcriptional activator
VARLITFGGLSARNGSVINGVANPRSRLAILAVLAVAGERGIRREKLAALFWPDSDEERARTALRQALFTLKRDIGAGDITIGVSDLRLNPDVLTADVTDFDVAIRNQRFADAAGFYRGSFLDGVYLRESPEFERWAEEQRTRLSSEYGRALERAAEAAREGGDHRAACDWWEKRARHDPLSGRVARLYMEALAAAGDREQAIRYAFTHAELVKEELEAEPDAEVLSLAERLREATGGSRSTGSAVTDRERHDVPDPDSSTGNLASDTHRTAMPWHARTGNRIAVTVAAITVLGFAVRSLLAKGHPIQPGLVAIGDFENRTGDSTLNSVSRLASSRIIEVLTLSGHGGTLDLREVAGSGGATRDLQARARRTSAEYLVRGALELRGDSLTMIGQVQQARSAATRLQMEPITVSLLERDRIVDEVRERLGGAIVALGDTAFPLWRTGRSRPPRYSAYHEFKQGIDALVNQGMRPAIQHFVKSMELDPGFAQAKLWYLEQASALASESLRVDSVRAAVLVQRVTFVAYDQVATDRQVAFIDGRLEDVYTAARQMVAMAPTAPDVKMLLAQAAFATRRFREAIDQLHGIHTFPAWVGGLNQRRNWDLSAHRLLGDLDVGIAEWRQAVAENPDRVNVCEQGFSLLAAAGLESAIDSLLVACERLPDARPNADRNLQTAGRNLRMNGYDDAAERAFRRALEIRSKLAATGGRPMFGVALLHMDLGEWQAAYDILLAIPNPNGDVRVSLGVSAAHVGDTARAREVIAWTETLNKRNGAEMDRALVELALGERDRALASLRAAIASGVSPGWTAWYVRPIRLILLYSL